MLTELRVRDLLVIADATLALRPGLNVLTGETGAGKSMLIDALALLLGERATGDLVRPGRDRAVVEAAFEAGDETLGAGLARAADAAGVDLEDGRLVVRREIRASGPNRAWANGSPATVGSLATLGRMLVDLHGQHEAQSLLRRASQRDMLDAFADAQALRERVTTDFEAAARCRDEEETLLRRRDEITKRADYLRHVVREIADAAPTAGEDERLAAEAKRLASSEEITRLGEELAGALDDEEEGTLHRLAAADRALSHLERLDDTVAGWRDLLDTTYAAAEELARVAREYAGSVDLDPAHLDEVERRRDTLFRLTQKYGPGLDRVLETAAETQRELELLDTAEFDLASIRERREVAERALADAAAQLTAARTAAAGRLSRDVGKLLPGLGMPGGTFSVDVVPAPAVSASGGDRVTFLVQLNVGLEARPLADVASGGELSRLMLALKVVLARHDAVPTLVFDEVDQGIGGEIGNQVAEALSEVAQTRQVLVITHLPQIAARAANHLRIAKRRQRGMTTATVEVLQGAEREREIARMLGDAEDSSLRQHAGQLLASAGRGGNGRSASG